MKNKMIVLSRYWVLLMVVILINSCKKKEEEPTHKLTEDTSKGKISFTVYKQCGGSTQVANGAQGYMYDNPGNGGTAWQLPVTSSAGKSFIDKLTPNTYYYTFSLTSNCGSGSVHKQTSGSIVVTAGNTSVVTATIVF